MAPVRSSLFDISLKQSNHTITIIMHIDKKEATTKDMPYISSVLKRELPTILRSTCFNEENIPFYKEVLSTELGHLFEHIMLEYLCLAKISLGFDEAIFSGVTKWDWNQDPYGTFRIELFLEQEDLLFVSPALNKTIRLFERILRYNKQQFLPSPTLRKPQMHT